MNLVNACIIVAYGTRFFARRETPRFSTRNRSKLYEEALVSLRGTGAFLSCTCVEVDFVFSIFFSGVACRSFCGCTDICCVVVHTDSSWLLKMKLRCLYKKKAWKLYTTLYSLEALANPPKYNKQ